MTDATPYFDIVASTPHALRLVGELDAHAAERLDAVITDTLVGDVRLDMAEVTFIDSSGLRSLIVHHQRIEATGHRLVIVSPSPTVARLFDLSEVGDYLRIEP